MYFIFAFLLFKSAYLLLSNYGRKEMRAINELMTQNHIKICLFCSLCTCSSVSYHNLKKFNLPVFPFLKSIFWFTCQKLHIRINLYQITTHANRHNLGGLSTKHCRIRGWKQLQQSAVGLKGIQGQKLFLTETEWCLVWMQSDKGDQEWISSCGTTRRNLFP